MFIVKTVVLASRFGHPNDNPRYAEDYSLSLIFAAISP